MYYNLLTIDLFPLYFLWFYKFLSIVFFNFFFNNNRKKDEKIEKRTYRWPIFLNVTGRDRLNMISLPENSLLGLVTIY